MTGRGQEPEGDVDWLLRSLNGVRGQPAEPIESLAARMLDALRTDEAHDAALVRAVCELAADPDPLVSRRGQQILFANIAESLGDSFAPESIAIHDRIFAQVVDFCRHHPEAPQVDSRLSQFGVRTLDDLVARRARVAQALPLQHEARERIRKVFVLSRITLGADVAVTSAMLQVVERVFPEASRYFVGPSSSGELLAGAFDAQTIDLSYDRNGLLGRIDSWQRLTLLLEREAAGLGPGEWVVIDPDSRLTQLGILPVAPQSVPYLFFESRSYRVPGLETIGTLAAHWLSAALGVEGEPARPRVAIAPGLAARAQSVVGALRRSDSFVVALNLGVGGNPRKRMAGEFELKLVRALLGEGARVVIDHGAGEDEQRVRAIVAALKLEGSRVGELTPDLTSEAIAMDSDVLTYRGPVSPFAALIAASDLYVGYDSAFQHIAAAQNTAVVDIFVNPPNDIFPRRWRPTSAALVTVLEATGDEMDAAAVARVLGAIRQLRQAIAR